MNTALRLPSLVVFLMFSIILRSPSFAQTRDSATRPATRPSIKSPEIAADGRVTFRLWAPQANSVIVSNIGPGGNSYNSRTPMSRDDQGVWSVTTPPLEPDLYAYSFLVDGVQMLDPANARLQTGFNSHQSQLRVPGNQVWDLKPQGERGVLAQHAFHSAVADDDRDFWVYSPPGYDAKRAEPYPVLFLLHGLGDRADSWNSSGAANIILDNLINAGQATPMIVVLPLGYARAGGPGNAIHSDLSSGFQRSLLEEVMPRVERFYNVAHDTNHRAIAGLSMGGAEAVYVGLHHPEMFAYVGSFSGAFLLWPSGLATTKPSFQASNISLDFPELNADAVKPIKHFWLSCGTADGLIDMNRQFHDWLVARNVPCKYQEIPDIGHVWPLWRRNLAAFGQEIFKD